MTDGGSLPVQEIPLLLPPRKHGRIRGNSLMRRRPEKPRATICYAAQQDFIDAIINVVLVTNNNKFREFSGGWSGADGKRRAGPDLI